MAKQISIDTDHRKGQLFKVTETGGRYHTYETDVGFFTSHKKIGEAGSLQDALEIIKAQVKGTVREVRIKDL